MQLLKILIYFDLFDYPLKKEETLSYLEYTPSNSPLKGEENIEEEDGFYFLKGRKEIIQIRKKREKYAHKLWKKTFFYLWFLKFVPFLKMVSVCNTLAFNHPEKGSDIDLFIVTAKNRIWIARILTTFLLQILGVRRHGKKVSARFCLSFWCSEEAINLESIQIQPQDPYLAFWCLTLKPVLDNDLYKKFIQENYKWIEKKYKLKFKNNHPWTSDLNINIKKQKQKKAPYKSNLIAKFFEFILKGKLGNLIEKKLSKKLKPRAEKKAKLAGSQASIIITDQMLKFHNKDKRREILERWRNSLSN